MTHLLVSKSGPHKVGEERFLLIRPWRGALSEDEVSLSWDLLKTVPGSSRDVEYTAVLRCGDDYSDISEQTQSLECDVDH